MSLKLTTVLAALLLAGPALADDWQATLDAARGQTVYWNAWGGDERTNAFIEWVGQETDRLYGVKVEQVKLTDTAEAVTRVVSEKAAGQNDGGSVDMIWINGPNFLAMKEQGLLHGPLRGRPAEREIPRLVAHFAQRGDFTVPVEGLESPWRLAKFVFNYDTARVAAPPTTTSWPCRLGGGESGAVHSSRPVELHGCDFPEAGTDRTGARPFGAATADHG